MVKSPSEYLESLRDGRAVYLDGERVEDVTTHPGFLLPLAWAMGDYERWPGPESLQFYRTEEGAEARRLFQVPRSAEDLRVRIELLGRSSVMGGLVNCVFAPLTLASRVAAERPDLAENMLRFYRYCRDEDLRLSEVVTDVKGDRSRKALEQDDPDLYLRVVDRTDGGIVVRGAKVHITGAAIAHELLVIPTKAMSPGEEQYSVAFSVPAATPGVKIICRGPADGRGSRFDYPVSGHHYLHEAMVIFDDVFVPKERVFLDGQTHLAGAFAHALGLWERAMGSIQGVRKAKMMVGLAQLLAEYNGTASDPHVQGLIVDMIFHAEFLRMALEESAAKPQETEDGMVYPDGRALMAAGYFGASNYHNMVRNLQEIAGVALVSLPKEADFRNEELSGDLERYIGTAAASAEERLLAYNLCRDITTDRFGSHARVVSVQGGGGLAAPRIIAYRSFDIEGAKALARAAAGISS